MAYFNYFPTIGYDVRGEKNTSRVQAITNVLVRIRKKLELTNIAYFDQYFVTDGDRPDSLAHQIYGDSELHWIILYANYMTNPYYDWPLTSFDLQKYVAKKYSNTNGTHHWEDTDGYEVDETASGATAVTNFVYEEKKNDAKRSINIIKKTYISGIIKEFKKLVG
jgi:hypothetical protein